jgi:hypothetical protein
LGAQLEAQELEEKHSEDEVCVSFGHLFLFREDDGLGSPKVRHLLLASQLWHAFRVAPVRVSVR